MLMSMEWGIGYLGLNREVQNGPTGIRRLKERQDATAILAAQYGVVNLDASLICCGFLIVLGVLAKIRGC
jgi:hypothetical protein